MIKSAASKVMWVGRATVFLVGLAMILALVFGVASTAFAHKGNTGFFHLGHKNVSKAVSTLVKQGPGPALSLVVQSGQPPLKVNSSGKVANLNADRLDGKSSEGFYAAGSKVADADKLDGKDSGAFASFGDSVLKPGFTVPTCSSGREIASIPVSVPQPSRVHASGVLNYSVNGTNGNQAVVRMDLLNEVGTVVASGGKSDTWGSDGYRAIAVESVLRQGNNAYDSSAVPFVATPGNNYKLRLTISTTGTCGATAGNAYVPHLSLNYILIGTP